MTELSVTVELIYYAGTGVSGPSPVTVTATEGEFAIDAMYRAAREDTRYNFGGEYDGESDRWVINKYNSISDHHTARRNFFQS